MFISLHLDVRRKGEYSFQLSEEQTLYGDDFYRVLKIRTDKNENELNIFLTSDQAKELAETIQQALEGKAEGVA